MTYSRNNNADVQDDVQDEESCRPDGVHTYEQDRNVGPWFRDYVRPVTNGHLTLTLQGSGIKFTTSEASLRGIIYCYFNLLLGHQMVKAPGFYLLSLSKIEISQLNSTACDSDAFIYFYYLSGALPSYQHHNSNSNWRSAILVIFLLRYFTLLPSLCSSANWSYSNRVNSLPPSKEDLDNKKAVGEYIILEFFTTLLCRMHPRAAGAGIDIAS